MLRQAKLAATQTIGMTLPDSCVSLATGDSYATTTAPSTPQTPFSSRSSPDYFSLPVSASSKKSGTMTASPFPKQTADRRFSPFAVPKMPSPFEMAGFARRPLPQSEQEELEAKELARDLADFLSNPATPAHATPASTPGLQSVFDFPAPPNHAFDFDDDSEMGMSSAWSSDEDEEPRRRRLMKKGSSALRSASRSPTTSLFSSRPRHKLRMSFLANRRTETRIPIFHPTSSPASLDSSERFSHTSYDDTITSSPYTESDADSFTSGHVQIFDTEAGKPHPEEAQDDIFGMDSLLPPPIKPRSALRPQIKPLEIRRPLSAFLSREPYLPAISDARPRTADSDASSRFSAHSNEYPPRVSSTNSMESKISVIPEESPIDGYMEEDEEDESPLDSYLKDTAPEAPAADKPTAEETAAEDSSDAWAMAIDHANFIIQPEPYKPENADILALKQLRTDRELARANYKAHFALIAEQYGTQSPMYKLTEQRWAEVENQWIECNDNLIGRIAAAPDAQLALRETPLFATPGLALIRTESVKNLTASRVASHPSHRRFSSMASTTMTFSSSAPASSIHRQSASMDVRPFQHFQKRRTQKAAFHGPRRESFVQGLVA
jgi:hypothetical protein